MKIKLSKTKFLIWNKQRSFGNKIYFPTLRHIKSNIYFDIRHGGRIPGRAARRGRTTGRRACVTLATCNASTTHTGNRFTTCTLKHIALQTFVVYITINLHLFVAFNRSESERRRDGFGYRRARGRKCTHQHRQSYTASAAYRPGMSACSTSTLRASKQLTRYRLLI